MATGINYLDETWNTITGCSGKGCKVRDRCWARDMTRRFPAVHGYQFPHPDWSEEKLDPFDKVIFHRDRLDKPLHWKKPRRIGVCFTGDWMDDQVVDRYPEVIYQMAMIMDRCPQHQFFTLTKQPQNILKLKKSLTTFDVRGFPSNCYLGVSITDQEDADRMIPEFLKIPGKHWVSWEPALEPINLIINSFLYSRINKTIDWLVIGCESGPKRRPMPLEWAYDVVEQCKSAGVPVFVKQLDIGGKVVHDINLFPPELQIREYPDRR